MEERTYNKEERFDARTIEALKLHYTESCGGWERIPRAKDF